MLMLAEYTIVPDPYIISHLQSPHHALPETVYLILLFFFHPASPALQRSQAFKPLCFLHMPFLLPGMLGKLLFILQSSAVPDASSSNTPTVTSQQSWPLLPLCSTILHAETALLSSRSWSLSPKQGGNCPAPASSSSKGGCATEAICRWNIWSK